MAVKLCVMQGTPLIVGFGIIDPGIDRVISGPMRGLKKLHDDANRLTDRQTDTHTDRHDISMTESA